MADFMTATEAARRLGVKPATLYAYVSRGVLSRDKAADGRASLFDPDEVERLARRGRPRWPAGVADITIGRARGWTEHHRGHGGLPAPACHFDNFGHIRTRLSLNNPNGNFRLGR